MYQSVTEHGKQGRTHPDQIRMNLAVCPYFAMRSIHICLRAVASQARKHPDKTPTLAFRLLLFHHVFCRMHWKGYWR